MRLVSRVALAATCFFATAANAGMGNLALNYGLLPTDVASAQALSLFNSQVSAVYYNPAYLAEDPRGELTTGIMHVSQDMRVKSLGGSNPPMRTGETIDDTPSQQLLLGMKTDLTDISQYERPLYFAVMLLSLIHI